MAGPSTHNVGIGNDHWRPYRHDHQLDDDLEGGGGAVPYADELGFLTVDYLSDLMRFDGRQQRLVLDMSGQHRIFARYPRRPTMSSPSAAEGPTLRGAFIERLVLCVLHHPLGEEIKHLHLSGVGCGDDFIAELCQQTVRHPKQMTPNLEVLDVDTNRLSDAGLLAVVDVLKTRRPVAWQHLRELRVGNNSSSNRVERAFCEAIVERAKWTGCAGLTKFNLEFRNPQYRETVHAVLFQNLDTVRRDRVAGNTLREPQPQVGGGGSSSSDDPITTTADSDDLPDRQGPLLFPYLVPCCRCDFSSSLSPSFLSLFSWMTIRPSQERMGKRT
jgi:hypothetical protein